MKNLLLGTVLAVSVTACAAVDVTTSGFDKPSASGPPNGVSDVRSWGADRSLVTGNRYAHEIGLTWNDKFGAYAGISGTPSVVAPPSTGVVVMTGGYQVSQIYNIDPGLVYSSGYPRSRSGAIAVSVDYGNRTLTGSDGTLTLNGTFAGTTLDGRATYDGVAGPLEGLVGADEAIGVFHGNSSDKVHAGGFIVNP